MALRCSWAVHPLHCLCAGETLPMRKPTTGEPYAGEPHVRFGGRGGVQLLPDPYLEASASNCREKARHWCSVLLGLRLEEVRHRVVAGSTTLGRITMVNINHRGERWVVPGRRLSRAQSLFSSPDAASALV